MLHVIAHLRYAQSTGRLKSRSGNNKRKTLPSDWLDRAHAEDADGRQGDACLTRRRTSRVLLLFVVQFSVQTFIVFMPVSASVRVLKVPLSTTVVVVVVGLLSTIVHFFVVASLTT